MRQNTPVYDSLQAQRQSYNLGQPKSSKQAMQQLYKQQLDSFMQQKQRQRQNERIRQQQAKREFNEKAQQGKEAEKLKQLSYKNYYHMLMNNQSQHQEAYISPFSRRDAMKDTLIDRGVENQRKRYQQFEIEIKKRQQQRKIEYKQQLLGQIQERRRKEQQGKSEEIRQKQRFQKNAKLPEQLQRYEKERKKQQMERYRQDLDRVREDQQYRNKSQSQYGLTNKVQYHNILTNPLPFNIQNPYILKQMGKNQSYLAMKGSQNLQL